MIDVVNSTQQYNSKVLVFKVGVNWNLLRMFMYFQLK